MILSALLRSIIFSSLAMWVVACTPQPQAFHDIHGKEIHLENYRSNWLVINYWAGWCKPCFEEIPELNAFYQAHKKDGIVVLGVDFDQVPVEALKQLVAKMKIEYPVLTTDPRKILGITDVASLPATYIFEPGGKLVETLHGKQTQKDLEETIEAAKEACNGHHKRYLLF